MCTEDQDKLVDALWYELRPGATENFTSMKLSACRLCDAEFLVAKENLENPEPCQGHQASIDFGAEFLGFGGNL